MKKSTAVRVTLAILILVGIFLFQFLRTTTYQEVLSNLIEKEETVEQITVYTQLGLTKQTAKVTIKNEEMINSIINEKIKLKKEISLYNPPPPPILDNTLVIETTTKDKYIIGFDENRIKVNKKLYFTESPVVNPIYMFILKKDLKWEISQYYEQPIDH
ncbi:hypothetical protein [Fredinandcohnia sp. 179-A 10B2 NHS]|uniref:hypothetical protein n=1 Tax=Fredinandcohnia sp. 179-A 10B2 NHS TaxID=3235176 RepID=UPI0039A26467